MAKSHSPPQVADSVPASAPPAHQRQSASDLLQRAATEPSSRLPDEVAAPLSKRVGADFAGVRVHRGAASHEAAERMGARAYTLGRHIHLNRLADNLSAEDRRTLLTHEAVHSAQQGGGDVSPQPGLTLGPAGDASEAEAERIASAPQGSPSLALRDRLLTLPLQQHHAPRLQRDLKGPRTSLDGDFDLKLKTESHKGAKSGMSGTIDFTPAAKAPDSKSIRLLQIVKLTNASTGKDYQWTGAEANRNKAMTTADKSSGVAGGYFVDHSAAAATPRTAKADAPVSPYYRDYWPNPKESHDGSKQGSKIKSASLWDYPGWSSEGKFEFETAAKATDTGYVYATLTWGFTLSNAAKGEVTGEYAKANYVQSATFNAAAKQFDEFYKNPGAASAPAK